MDSAANRPSSPADVAGYASIADAAAALRVGGVVAIPTDTVYGLAASAFDESAISRVFEIKGRRQDAALPVLLAEPEDMERCAASVPKFALLLTRRFWPGALTIIVRKSAAIPDLLTGGVQTVGLRVPDHPVPRELAALLGAPITGTSANLSGMPSIRTASEVRHHLGGLLDAIVDGGDLTDGEPSTVVDLTASPPRLVRQGAVSNADICEAAGVEFLPL